MNEVQKIADQTPAVNNAGSRFGNPAFKEFYDKIEKALVSLHDLIPGLKKEAIPEVSLYFKECWGNRTRIDYGSGMELNFLCWLYVLHCKLELCCSVDGFALAFASNGLG